jgi:hypothetical protein
MKQTLGGFHSVPYSLQILSRMSLFRTTYEQTKHYAMKTYARVEV